jgi:uncharacterized protein (DUF736 family)
MGLRWPLGALKRPGVAGLPALILSTLNYNKETNTMKCGFLTVNVSEGRRLINGSFLSWAYPKIDFILIENRDRNSNEQPTHEIRAKNPHGASVVIGAAWQNQINKGKKRGLPCYSITLDEPTLFKTPVRLAAFPTNPDASEYSLQFSQEKELEEAA